MATRLVLSKSTPVALVVLGAITLALLVLSPTTLGAHASQIPAAGAQIWKKFATPTSHPSARTGAVMAYDNADADIVLFGGTGKSGNLNDTWTFHAGNWTRLSTPVAPGPRAFPSMAYDRATSSVILFGGFSNTSSPQGCSGSPSRAVYCNDTWSFVHGAWSLLHPTKSPSARYSAAMAYDVATHALILGEGNDGNNLTDMWSFSGGTWSSVPTGGPGMPFDGRWSPMAFDHADTELVFLGPTGGNETWVFNATGWHRLAPPLSPRTSFQSDLAFDFRLRTVVLFGGDVAQGTWGFHAGAWTNLTSGKQPASRFGGAMAYDAADGYLVLFGGTDLSTRALLHDTWKLI